MRQAYSLHVFRMPSPRVLPWVTVSNPVGLMARQLEDFESDPRRSPEIYEACA